ncbi:MAG: Uncharacterised protein [Prochlorococcus marinus str. MIT 9215]|nr:MAG: Uncharacterised protein [Prochlorococcus marinus str. MIT 9215]
MKRLGRPWLSLAPPLLILLAILALFQRQGSDGLQSLPAFLVGAGLIVHSAVGRRRRRRQLLLALRGSDSEES